jgi:hypothetical protein
MVVSGPEDVEDFFVGGLGRVEIDLEGFGVIAELVIGGVFQSAAAEADAGAYDTGESPKLGLGFPESAQRQGGSFDLGGSGLVHGRHGPRTLLLLGRYQGQAQTER